MAKAKKMTLDEFFKWLPKTGWMLHNNKLRRNTLRPQCPVTSVARRQRHKVYDLLQWRYAAEDIGLSLKKAWAIVEAADNTTNGALRRRLLKHCGLA